jgi:hypothetical protein
MERKDHPFRQRGDQQMRKYLPKSIAWMEVAGQILADIDDSSKAQFTTDAQRDQLACVFLMLPKLLFFTGRAEKESKTGVNVVVTRAKQLMQGEARNLWVMGNEVKRDNGSKDEGDEARCSFITGQNGVTYSTNWSRVQSLLVDGQLAEAAKAIAPDTRVVVLSEADAKGKVEEVFKPHAGAAHTGKMPMEKLLAKAKAILADAVADGRWQAPGNGSAFISHKQQWRRPSRRSVLKVEPTIWDGEIST